MVATTLLQNPAYLKIDLYCQGARLSPDLMVEQAGGRRILRTRAGLGSGLELVLPGDLWTNVPVTEDFAKVSPYEIGPSPSGDESDVEIRYNGEAVATARLAPRPAWYDRKTSSGRPMTQIGTLQGTYLGIYPGKVCEFWNPSAKSNCHFCSVGLNLGVDDSREKTIRDILEVAHAAQEESEITYVDFNAGHADDFSYLDMLEPIVSKVKEETGLLIGLQAPPHPDLTRYDRLRNAGVNRVSFCFEIFDPQRFVEVCPGKAKTYGLRKYLEAVEYCASLGARGPSGEPWVTNGELIAGLERPESTIAAIDWLTERGAVPTVCVFRPLRGTDYVHVPPPTTEEMVPVFRHLFEACARKNLPIGVAPNVHVSLVMLPEEGRFLSDDWGLKAAWQMKRAPKALAAKWWLRSRTRRAKAQIAAR